MSQATASMWNKPSPPSAYRAERRPTSHGPQALSWPQVALPHLEGSTHTSQQPSRSWPSVPTCDPCLCVHRTRALPTPHR